MRPMILSALAAFALVAVPAHAESLIVDLAGVRDAGGTLYVSVQTRVQFMQQEGTAGSVVSLPGGGSHSFRYDVPAGEYAVTVWHDDNGNRRFDMNERQIPLDGWAMVNGEQLRAEPSFDQVKTVVGDAPVHLSLAMIYGR